MLKDGVLLVLTLWGGFFARLLLNICRLCMILLVQKTTIDAYVLKSVR